MKTDALANAQPQFNAFRSDGPSPYPYLETSE
jgi:hypothetical protein